MRGTGGHVSWTEVLMRLLGSPVAGKGQGSQLQGQLGVLGLRVKRSLDTDPDPPEIFDATQCPWASRSSCSNVDNYYIISCINIKL